MQPPRWIFLLMERVVYGGGSNMKMVTGIMSMVPHPCGYGDGTVEGQMVVQPCGVVCSMVMEMEINVEMEPPMDMDVERRSGGRWSPHAALD